MSIENPTLAHFRHFSSLFTNLPSTSVENPLQINLFMQNKPNFQKSQMNVKFIQERIMKINAIGHLVKTNPIQTQTNPIASKPK